MRIYSSKYRKALHSFRKWSEFLYSCQWSCQHKCNLSINGQGNTTEDCLVNSVFTKVSSVKNTHWG